MMLHLVSAVLVVSFSIPMDLPIVQADAIVLSERAPPRVRAPDPLDWAWAPEIRARLFEDAPVAVDDDAIAIERHRRETALQRERDRLLPASPIVRHRAMPRERASHRRAASD